MRNKPLILFLFLFTLSLKSVSKKRKEDTLDRVRAEISILLQDYRKAKNNFDSLSENLPSLLKKRPTPLREIGEILNKTHQQAKKILQLNHSLKNVIEEGYPGVRLLPDIDHAFLDLIQQISKSITEERARYLAHIRSLENLLESHQKAQLKEIEIKKTRQQLSKLNIIYKRLSPYDLKKQEIILKKARKNTEKLKDLDQENKFLSTSIVSLNNKIIENKKSQEKRRSLAEKTPSFIGLRAILSRHPLYHRKSWPVPIILNPQKSSYPVINTAQADYDLD